MKAMKWIDIEKTGVLPSIDTTEDWCNVHGHSKRVLVAEREGVYFGRYVKSLNAWILEGRNGNVEVTHWCPIILPKTK